MIRSPATAIAWAMVERPSTVMTLPFVSTRSAGWVSWLTCAGDDAVCAAFDVTPLARTVAIALPAPPAPFRKSRRGMLLLAIRQSCSGTKNSITHRSNADVQFIIIIEVAQVVLHEGDEPDAVADFRAAGSCAL
jgi:hypothetical protein